MQIYNRIGIFKIEEVLPFVVPEWVVSFMHWEVGLKKNNPRFKYFAEREYKGHSVKMYSQRYQLFASHGVTCKRCKIQGKYFALEKHSSETRYHFNLYGVDKKGREVLITKDHIKAKKNGGANSQSNYQVLCTHCNCEKGHK